MAKPPAGGSTGAVPLGRPTASKSASVKVAVALREEDWPVAVTINVEPTNSSDQKHQTVTKFPPVLVVTSDHSATKVFEPSGLTSSIFMVTASLAPNPVPVMTTSLNGG